MRLQILLLLSLSVFRKSFCSEHPLEQQNKVAKKRGERVERAVSERPPLYPHSIGISNSNNNCYMNSLFSCLYNTPFFQSSVYQAVNELPSPLPKKSASVLLSLADIFVKMRLDDKASVSLKKTMFPAIKSAFDWNVGEYQCVLEFWGRIFEQMPESIVDAFTVKVKTHYYCKATNKLIKSVDDKCCYINIPTPKAPAHLSEIIGNNFLDIEQENYKIEPQDQHEYGHILDGPINEIVEIPAYSTVTFENTPDFLVFGVKRLGWNRKMNTTELNEVNFGFDVITVNREMYQPYCFVLFDGDRSHYYNFSSDILNLKKYFINDDKVSILDFKSYPSLQADWIKKMLKSNVMVFYMKISALKALISSKAFVTILKNEDISPVLLVNRKNSPPGKKRANEAASNDISSKRLKKTSPSLEREIKGNGAIQGATEFIKGDSRAQSKAPIESKACWQSETEDDTEDKEEIDSDEDDIASISSDIIFKDFQEDSSSESKPSLDIPENFNFNETPSFTDDTSTNASNARIECRKSNATEDGEFLSSIDYLTNQFNLDKAEQNNEPSLLTVQNVQQQQFNGPHSGEIPLLGFKLSQNTHQVDQDYSSGSSAVFVQNRPTIPGTKQSTLQSSIPPIPSATSPEASFIKPTLDDILDEDKEKMKDIQRLIIGKYRDPEYMLGSEEFSFSPLTCCHALEMILTGFASNSFFLRGLLKLVSDTKQNSEFFKDFTIIMIQMLIGCKEINLNKLKKYIEAQYSIKISNQSLELKMEQKIVYCLNFFCEFLPNNLMKYPASKNIIYSKLDTDDPLSISYAKASDLPLVDPRGSIPVRPGIFSGVLFDRIYDGNRSRTVLSAPESLVFPIISTRTNFTGVEFVSNHLNPGSIDNMIFGCISYGPVGNVDNFSATFISNQQRNSKLTYDSVNGPKIIKADKNFMDIFSNSFVLFAIKSAYFTAHSIKLCEIPMEIFSEVVFKCKIDFFTSRPNILQIGQQNFLNYRKTLKSLQESTKKK